MKVLVSDRAKLDLLRIYSFVAQHSSAAATAIIRRVDVRLRQLSRFPFIGRERSNLAPGLRGLLAGNYVIFYRVEGDQIIVARVIDQRMDIDEEFRR